MAQLTSRIKKVTPYIPVNEANCKIGGLSHWVLAIEKNPNEPPSLITPGRFMSRNSIAVHAIGKTKICSPECRSKKYCEDLEGKCFGLQWSENVSIIPIAPTKARKPPKINPGQARPAIEVISRDNKSRSQGATQISTGKKPKPATQANLPILFDCVWW